MNCSSTRTAKGGVALSFSPWLLLVVGIIGIVFGIHCHQSFQVSKNCKSPSIGIPKMFLNCTRAKSFKSAHDAFRTRGNN